jgi:hypothetical protein
VQGCRRDAGPVFAVRYPVCRGARNRAAARDDSVTGVHPFVIVIARNRCTVVLGAGRGGFAGSFLQLGVGLVWILIDGRSLYAPRHGGVGRDLQNLVLDDVEPIEAIR